MSTSIDKKAARFGRWGLGIPRNIREGTAKYKELLNRSRRRYSQMLYSDSEALNKDLVKDIVQPALDEARTDILLANIRSVSNYGTRKLMQQYKQSPVFKRPLAAARLRRSLAQYKKSRRKQREIFKQLYKRRTILRDLYYADSAQQVAQSARKHSYGIYADVMPTWYKYVLKREMPAIIRKKMQLQRKGYKINPNPSDFGNTVTFSTGIPQISQLGIHNKPIANNADPFVPGMLYGAKDAKGITAFLRGQDVWFTPHRDVLQGYSGKQGRPYTITLNPKAQAVAGYSSAGKPLFTPHIAGDIYKPQMRSSIQQGTYTGGRTAGRASWGDRPDYQAVAYLKPFRYGIENWRNTGQFRVFSRSKDSDTGWQQVQPIPVRDKYDHLRVY